MASTCTDPSGSAAAAGASTTSSYSTAVSKIPGRSSLPDEAALNPHHIIKAGRVSGFKNPYPSWSNPANLTSILKNVVWPTITGQLKRPDTSPPTVPVQTPEWLPSRTASDKLRATWLGHACYYVEFPSGLRVLFDPVFEDRCSPFSFMGPKRFTQRPCELQDIPVIDAVLISHSHYDHLSHKSVLEIQKHHPDVQFFVGLGLETWFRKSGLNNVTELDWWEDADLNVKVKTGEEEETLSARVSALPCQHTSARSLWDKDTTLWCSWAVKSGDKSVWFGGDTGYRAVPALPAGTDDYGPEYEALPRCPQFKQIGELRGPFDLGLIPIGAYYPRVAFSAMHANPFDSVEIFVDTNCERAMGIHWGTWALTMEEVLEPPKLLREALKRKGLQETGVFDICDIGESREF
ncbi:beta-lactamase superfamily protein [Metarhizium robertsii]|uniref:NAPE-hydrolyzing phospholipase D n=2 Tax=Metarhizium robertsii TaxID=568076 RepID=E9ENZ9_METRA|nr:NAPE-hydrolyzing phospholipase D [Metarhizium robertsii ARSEF 23]EFZ02426.1 NAPE-hydrolyzing phospholipase D [Metarhizium robertsii ARSEF 23]EXV05619.1 beta-lactamase superfamily protein [Metarhizium robertsii]